MRENHLPKQLSPKAAAKICAQLLIPSSSYCAALFTRPGEQSEQNPPAAQKHQRIPQFLTWTVCHLRHNRRGSVKYCVWNTLSQTPAKSIFFLRKKKREEDFLALEHLLQAFEKLQPSVNLNFLITQFNIWSANTVNRLGTGVVVLSLLYWETKPEPN